MGIQRTKRAIPPCRGCECRDAHHEPSGSVGGGGPRDDWPATQSEDPGDAANTGQGLPTANSARLISGRSTGRPAHIAWFWRGLWPGGLALVSLPHKGTGKRNRIVYGTV